MKKRLVSVLTADIVGSTAYRPRDRDALHRAVQRALRQANAACRKDLALPITITVGDEFQGVVSPHWRALIVADILRGLMHCAGAGLPIDLYVAIGVAGGTLRKDRESRMQEGAAFYLSRRGMEALKASAWRRTAVVTEAEEPNKLLDLILEYQDMILSSWTPAQWEAVRLRDRSLNLKQIGRKVGVAYQNVQKRLKAARWEQYLRGREYLTGLLKRTPLIR